MYGVLGGCDRLMKGWTHPNHELSVTAQSLTSCDEDFWGLTLLDCVLLNIGIFQDHVQIWKYPYFGYEDWIPYRILFCLRIVRDFPGIL